VKAGEMVGSRWDWEGKTSKVGGEVFRLRNGASSRRDEGQCIGKKGTFGTRCTTMFKRGKRKTVPSWGQARSRERHTHSWTVEKAKKKKKETGPSPSQGTVL